MDPKDRFIKELLDVHGKEEKNPEHVPQWWDHPAQKDPMLIHMSWEQIRKIVLNLFPQIGMKDVFLGPSTYYVTSMGGGGFAK